MVVETREAEIALAHGMCDRHAWGEAHALLSRLEQTGPLAAHDAELLATSSYLLGRELDYFRFLERAHHLHLAQGDSLRAARSAAWVGLMLFVRGDTAQSSGWLARARRLVEGHDCVEHGYLLLPVAEHHLIEHEASAALALATDAVALGTRFADADLTACALHLQGRALIEAGQVQRGLGLLDETMIAVSEGELSPIMTGLLYCSVIDACQQVFALGRAGEWTAALSRWCEREPGLVAFTQTCLVHRAHLMQVRGAWGEAMTETRLAYARFSQEGLKAPAPLYRQGELHRLKGEFTEAEDAYRRASESGADPQPGLALLRMAQGRADAACAAIRRVVGAATDPLQRAKLLPAQVEIALACGDVAEAGEAAAELDRIARRYRTDALQAMAAQSLGAVALADGHASSALPTLRRAFELWQRTDAPYDAARARVLIARVCLEVGDAESASLELDAARGVFERLGATPDLAQLAAVRGRTAGSDPDRLTPREREVLRRIASGKTNKAIAGELRVSERTVDRHVSNILTKLGVPSRAAATAVAYDHRLL
jgi:DNA-binding CsgD family transcriptional regulator